MMGIPYDTKTPYTKTKVCHECDGKLTKRSKVVEIEIYDDPWATEPSTVRVHNDNDTDGYGSCFDKLFDSSWADFRYFECAECQRIIIRQCPYNGWRSYVKERNDEEICARCYQDAKLRDGEDEEIFAMGRIPGDFFSEAEISAHNWALVPGYGRMYITGTDSVHAFCRQARKLIKDGYKVLVDYDSMGIGGSEGYVSLYSKREV